MLQITFNELESFKVSCALWFISSAAVFSGSGERQSVFLM
jgi:hypothetical protein